GRVADLIDQLLVAGAVEDHDRQVAHVAPQRIGDDPQVSSTGRSRSTLPFAGGPTTSFSMYVSGACSRPPGSDTAMTAIALGRPLATGLVPSSGSTAMSTSGPSPRPTFSPI